MISRSDLNYIRKRWTDEKRISAKHVEALLDAADKALTMSAANDLRQSGRGRGLDGLVDDVLGR